MFEFLFCLVCLFGLFQMVSQSQKSCIGFFFDLIVAIFLFGLGVGSPFWHKTSYSQAGMTVTAHAGLFKMCVERELTGLECEQLDSADLPGRTCQNPPIDAKILF